MCEHFDTLTETKSCFKISLGRSIRQLRNKAKLMRHRGGQEKVVRFQSDVVVVLNRRMCDMCDAALPDSQDKEDAGYCYPQGWMHQFCWAAGEKLLLLAHGPHSWDESLTNPWKLVTTGQLYSLGTPPVECVQSHFRHNKLGRTNLRTVLHERFDPIPSLWRSGRHKFTCAVSCLFVVSK